MQDALQFIIVDSCHAHAAQLQSLLGDWQIASNSDIDHIASEKQLSVFLDNENKAYENLIEKPDKIVLLDLIKPRLALHLAATKPNIKHIEHLHFIGLTNNRNSLPKPLSDILLHTVDKPPNARVLSMLIDRLHLSSRILCKARGLKNNCEESKRL